jgi:phosphoglycerate dehydrogenase-like enzyme
MAVKPHGYKEWIMTWKNNQRTWKVAYMEAVPPDTAAIITSRLPKNFELSFVEDYSDLAARKALEDADFAVVATRPMTAELFNAAPGLRMIQHQGVGYDKTDVTAARVLGILVALCPSGTVIGVAEHTFLLILAVCKQLLRADASVRSGEWLQFSLRASSFEIAGKRLGLLGFGRIGEAVALRASAFEMRVSYFDIVRRSEVEEQNLGVEFSSFGSLLAESDILSLHLPSTQETRQIIDKEALEKMRRGSILINTSRGPLVDQKALIEVLRNGHLHGAGLDVFEQEPPNPNDPLLTLSNVVLTPHISAGTSDALKVKMDAVFDNLRRMARGEPPLHVVDPSD